MPKNPSKLHAEVARHIGRRDARLDDGDLFALVARLAQVYTVDTDQVALIKLVQEAQQMIRQGR